LYTLGDHGSTEKKLKRGFEPLIKAGIQEMIKRGESSTAIEAAFPRNHDKEKRQKFITQVNNKKQNMKKEAEKAYNLTTNEDLRAYAEGKMIHCKEDFDSLGKYISQLCILKSV
jgi:hypothetical protein